MIKNRLPIVTGQPRKIKGAVKYNAPDSTWNCNRSECKDGPGAHTHHQTVNNGSGWLERKASGEIVYHTPWLRKFKPFELKPLKTRQETSQAALVRMRKECVSSVEWERQLEMHMGAQGFVMTATDGHWALLEPGDVKTHKDFLGVTPKHKRHVLHDPEFYLALARAAVMANERSKTVQFVADAVRQEIVLYAEDSDVGDMTETVPAQLSTNWRIALNHEYLVMVLGSWPLTMYVRDEDSLIVFEAHDRSWRFVIMPISHLEHSNVTKAIKTYREEMR